MHTADITSRLKEAEPTIVLGPRASALNPFPTIPIIAKRISGAEEPVITSIVSSSDLCQLRPTQSHKSEVGDCPIPDRDLDELCVLPAPCEVDLLGFGRDLFYCTHEQFGHNADTQEAKINRREILFGLD